MQRSITRCYSIYRNENSCYTAVALVQQCTFFELLALNCIVFEFNVPRTKSNIKKTQLRSHITKPTELDQLYSRAFALRPNRALLVLASFKMVVGEKNAFAPVACINDLIRVQDPQLR